LEFFGCLRRRLLDAQSNYLEKKFEDNIFWCLLSAMRRAYNLLEKEE
jgi:hypothetical protein